MTQMREVNLVLDVVDGRVVFEHGLELNPVPVLSIHTLTIEEHWPDADGNDQVMFVHNPGVSIVEMNFKTGRVRCHGIGAERIADTMDPVAFAEDYARFWHKGKVDKAGVDYCDGHLATAVRYAKTLTDDKRVHAAVWLHDILEDTACPLQKLRADFGPEIAAWVNIVSRYAPKETYDAYICNIADMSREHPQVAVIKLADVMSNLDVERLLLLPYDKQEWAYKRYLPTADKMKEAIRRTAKVTPSNDE